MKKVRIACKICGALLMLLMVPTNVFASLTKDQAKDVALFATTFIEKGNERRDVNGYPLLVYALSNNWNTCVEIRRSGYNGELYYVKNNNYHMKNGKYLDLGLKWCMDCGDFISYVYKTTLGLDMYLEETEDPWHIKDMYADANKYENSEYFEFVYKNVPISSIDESKLELGDIVLRLGAKENHGLIYVGEGMQTAHASRNGIKYSKNPPILGFEVVTLNKFYKTSTIVSIIRVKDDIVSQNQKVNTTIIWPDTGEEEDLLDFEEKYKVFEACKIINEESHNAYLVKNLNSHKENIVEAKNNQNIGLSLYKLYISEVSKLDKNPNYFQKQFFDWLIYEIKKILLQKCF